MWVFCFLLWPLDCDDVGLTGFDPNLNFVGIHWRKVGCMGRPLGLRNIIRKTNKKREENFYPINK
jgi:hypothetical protein